MMELLSSFLFSFLIWYAGACCKESVSLWPLWGMSYCQHMSFFFIFIFFIKSVLSSGNLLGIFPFMNWEQDVVYRWKGLYRQIWLYVLSYRGDDVWKMASIKLLDRCMNPFSGKFENMVIILVTVVCNPVDSHKIWCSSWDVMAM